MNNLVTHVTEKQKNLLGTKIALLIGKFINENYPESVIQVFGDDHEYRAKLNIRHGKIRLKILMRKGLIFVEQVGAPEGPRGQYALDARGEIYVSSLKETNEKQKLNEKKFEIPLADPKAFEKTAKYTEELLCQEKDSPSDEN